MTEVSVSGGVDPMVGFSRGSRVMMTSVGLQIPNRMTFEDWAHAGCQLSGIVDSSAWWLGDWLVFGKSHYADCYQLAVQRAGLRYQTLRNYAWVARRFPVERRRAALTFQHHAELASMPSEEQDRLLDLAESGQWTTKQMRKAIRGQLGPAESSTSGTDTGKSQIELPPHRVAIWRHAASCVGLDLDRWMLSILDRAAHETLQS